MVKISNLVTFVLKSKQFKTLRKNPIIRILLAIVSSIIIYSILYIVSSIYISYDIDIEFQDHKDRLCEGFNKTDISYQDLCVKPLIYSDSLRYILYPAMVVYWVIVTLMVLWFIYITIGSVYSMIFPVPRIIDKIIIGIVLIILSFKVSEYIQIYRNIDIETGYNLSVLDNCLVERDRFGFIESIPVSSWLKFNNRCSVSYINYRTLLGYMRVLSTGILPAWMIIMICLVIFGSIKQLMACVLSLQTEYKNFLVSKNY